MFGVRDYYSKETYDIGKFMNFIDDTYDVLNSPFLDQLHSLPVSRYYVVENGDKDLDEISLENYQNAFLTYYIQYYNDLTVDTVPEGTELKLFSLNDLNDLCNKMYQISKQS